LEQAVLAAPLEGVVLRYGLFYGPGSSDEMVALMRKRRMPIVGSGDGIWSMTHLDDAAAAAVAALERGSGIYNVVDDEPAPMREVLTDLAKVIGSPAPRRIPVWLARLAAGEVVVSMTTQARGASNAKAKRELDWAPRWTTWRDGFRYGLGDTVAAAKG
jgi:nucleoside-diphosphate-sugar epimerase